MLNTNGVTSHHGGQLEAASRQQNGHHSSHNGGSGENIVKLKYFISYFWVGAHNIIDSDGMLVALLGQEQGKEQELAIVKGGKDSHAVCGGLASCRDDFCTADAYIITAEQSF